MRTNVFWLLPAILGMALCLNGQQYRIDTFAGGTNAGDGAAANSALLLQAQGLALDSQQRLYIADANDHRIRRIEKDGTITTVAGNGIAGFSGDGGPAVNAQLRTPYGLAIDRNDNLYIADLGNSRVRRVAVADGTISTWVGGGLTPPGGDNDGGPATDYVLGSPRDLVVDTGGSLFVSDFAHHQVLEVSPDLTLITIAGTGQAGFSGDGAAAFLAALNSPAGLALLDDGSLLVCDSGNHLVRRIANGRIRPFLPPTARSAIALSTPTAVALSPDGSVIVSDPQAGIVYRADSSGWVRLFDRAVSALAVDSAGNLYFSSQGFVNRRSADGSVVTVAGSTNTHFLGESVAATAARLDQPSAVVMDASGNAYIADRGNNRIRKVDSHGTITTFAGTGNAGYSGDGGAATDAELNQPSGLALDGQGNLLIADTGNNVIRRIALDGSITTIAGTGKPEAAAMDGELAATSPLNAPTGLAFANDRIYVADTGNHSVRLIDRDGTLRRIAGSDAPGSDGDGGPAPIAHLQTPRGISVRPDGTLYIADDAAGVVRRVDTGGRISTITNSSNGPWLAPSGLSLQADGALLVADAGTHEIRAIASDGSSVVLAGTGSAGYSGDTGPAMAAQLDAPTGVLAAANGAVYVADAGNGRVRLLTTGAASLPANVALVQVVNAASRVNGIVAPGEIVSILGSQLGFSETQYSDISLNLPTLVADTQVLINGHPAPIIFIGPGEIQIQIPYELQGANAAEMEVLWQGTPIAAANLTVATAAPGIYSLDGSGAGTALVIGEDGTINYELNPAGAGSMMTVFLTGEGLTTGQNQTGIPAVAGAVPQLPFTVFLNDAQAQTLVIQEVPGTSGLAAISFLLPDHLSGGATTLRIAAGGAVSQTNLVVWTRNSP